jgi:hypothetical protein
MTQRALKDRQLLTWAGLEKGPSAIVAALSVGVTILLAYYVWFPGFTALLGVDLPDLLKQVVVILAVMYQIYSGLGNNRTGTEEAQKFMGKYTGVSFSSGIYLLPRFPFPIFTFLLIWFESPLAKYFVGWMLEDEVEVNDRTIKIEFVVGTDDMRIKFKTTLLLEMMNASVYLIQSKTATDENQMFESITSQAVTKLRSQLGGAYSALDLYKGSLEGDETVAADLITSACGFVSDYGLRIKKVMHTDFEIMSPRMERALDAELGKKVLRGVSNEYAAAFAEFKAALPAGTSFEVAANMFNLARLDEGLPPVQLNVLQFK